MAELFATVVPVLGRALLHFLWQGAAIGLVAVAALHSLRNARPQVRYAVACTALLACALAPLVTVALLLAGSSASGGASVASAWASARAAIGIPSALPVDAASAAPRLDGVLPSIVALWAACACTLCLRMAFGVAWVGRLRAAPQGAGQHAWQRRVDALALRFGMGTVPVRLVDSLDSPATIGWWRPVVLLPTAVALRMPVDLVEALLAHELAHVRRHDYLVNLLQGVVEAFLFYHPVTWWLSRRIRIEREEVADRLAADATGKPEQLALALAELSESLVRRPGSTLPNLAQAAHGGQLMSRIQQLVQPGRRTSTTGRFIFPLLGLLAGSIALFAHAEEAMSSDYALVRGDDSITLSGDMDAVDDIRVARGAIGRDFIWFRRDGETMVIDDPATVARVADAWREVETLSPKMEALGEQMQAHGARMEEIGERMEAVTEEFGELPEMDGEKASARLAAHEQRLEAMHVRLDALSREMDAAAEPMDALGEQMDALGREHERHAQVAERKMKVLIDEAVGRGLAKPAPAAR